MRRSHAATAESKRRVVTAAARLMRERGPEGVSIAEVMAAAGMTHGGFYSHFPAKDALLAAATERAFAEKLEPIERAPAGTQRQEALLRYLDAYLSMGHVAAPGAGCPIAGLAPELGRAAPEVRAAMAGGVRQMLETLAAAAPTDGDARERAILVLASAVGAIVLARAVADPGLASDIIEAVRRSSPLAVVLPKAGIGRE
jgi:TetR/AcrR family transcriptional repressor of nem operon